MRRLYSDDHCHCDSQQTAVHADSDSHPYNRPNPNRSSVAYRPAPTPTSTPKHIHHRLLCIQYHGGGGAERTSGAGCQHGWPAAGPWPCCESRRSRIRRPVLHNKLLSTSPPHRCSERPQIKTRIIHISPTIHSPTSSFLLYCSLTSPSKAMTDILSQLHSLESKRAALDQVVRQTQARVRSSHAQDDRAAKRHAEELPATGAPAVASSVTIANSSNDSRRLSSPRDKQVTHAI
jgi:hypothetical protein